MESVKQIKDAIVQLEDETFFEVQQWINAQVETVGESINARFSDKMRYGYEQDPQVEIEALPLDSPETGCIWFRFGPHRFTTHTRTLCDIIHKAQMAYLDWVALVEKLEWEN